MAILSVIDKGVTENFLGLGAHDRVQPDGRIIGDARRFFDVLFDDADAAAVRPMLALSDGRVPQLGDSHPFSDWIYVLDRRASVDKDSPFLYHAVIQYKEIRDPISEPARIEWFSAYTMEPIHFGWNDDGVPVALLTSSNEPFDPPPMEETSDIILRGVFNVSSFNPVGAANYVGAINSDWFMGFAPGLAKVRTYSSRQIRDITANNYIEVTVEIQFRSTNWKQKFPDLGFRTKEGIVGGKQVYKTITVDPNDPTSDPVSEPVMLDGAGQIGSPLLITTLEYWTKPQLPFQQEFARLL